MDIVSKINGNTVAAAEFNQIPTELENLITSSGQTVSDAILNQDTIATSRYSANNFYIDSGVADAYVLTLASSMTNPVSSTVGYFIGMTIRFRAGNAGTGGAATVNVNGAGVKSLKEADGTTNPLPIPTNVDSEFRYNGTVFVKANDLGTAANYNVGTTSGTVPLIGTQSATETLAGLTPIATQALTNAITNDLAFITPKKLGNGFAISLGANGYIKLPSWMSGFTLMWGSNAFASGSDNTSFSITFPATFTNAIYALVGNNSTATTGTASGMIVEFSSTTTSGATCNVNQRNGSVYSAGSVKWIGIGY